MQAEFQNIGPNAEPFGKPGPGKIEEPVPGQVA